MDKVAIDYSKIKIIVKVNRIKYKLINCEKIEVKKQQGKITQPKFLLNNQFFTK